jgi:WD domain, G-beta repeat
MAQQRARDSRGIDGLSTLRSPRLSCPPANPHLRSPSADFAKTLGQPHGAPLTGHTGPVFAVAFSPNGQLLATASADGTARLWDVTDTNSISQLLTGHSNTVNAVAFSPNAQLLATASQDSAVWLWNPFFHDWRKTGCKLINRNLSMAEWNQLIPGIPYERTCPDLPAGQGAPPDAAPAQ